MPGMYARTYILLRSKSIAALGAFDDELMAALLGIDGVDEFVIYCAAVGKKDVGTNHISGSSG
jgi:hypothetical protein